MREFFDIFDKKCKFFDENLLNFKKGALWIF